MKEMATILSLVALLNIFAVPSASAGACDFVMTPSANEFPGALQDAASSGASTCLYLQRSEPYVIETPIEIVGSEVLIFGQFATLTGTTGSEEPMFTVGLNSSLELRELNVDSVRGVFVKNAGEFRTERVSVTNLTSHAIDFSSTSPAGSFLWQTGGTATFDSTQLLRNQVINPVIPDGLRGLVIIAAGRFMLFNSTFFDNKSSIVFPIRFVTSPTVSLFAGADTTVEIINSVLLDTRFEQCLRDPTSYFTVRSSAVADTSCTFMAETQAVIMADESAVQVLGHDLVPAMAAPTPDGPLIDAANAKRCAAFDLVGNRRGTDACDMGAVAFQAGLVSGLSVANNVFQLSGTYYDRSRDGEGLQVAVLPSGDRLVMTFFTYVDGQQAWLIGAGFIEGDFAVIEDLTLTEGADYGDQFDADDVERIALEPARLEWQSCNEVDLTLPPLFGEPSRVFTLQRAQPGDCLTGS